eukprot:UN30726
MIHGGSEVYNCPDLFEGEYTFTCNDGDIIFVDTCLPSTVYFEDVGVGVCRSETGGAPANLWADNNFDHDTCSGICKNTDNCIGYSLHTIGICALWMDVEGIPSLPGFQGVASEGWTLGDIIFVGSGDPGWTCRALRIEIVPIPSAAPTEGPEIFYTDIGVGYCSHDIDAESPSYTTGNLTAAECEFECTDFGMFCIGFSHSTSVDNGSCTLWIDENSGDLGTLVDWTLSQGNNWSLSSTSTNFLNITDGNENYNCVIKTFSPGDQCSGSTVTTESGNVVTYADLESSAQNYVVCDTNITIGSGVTLICNDGNLVIVDRCETYQNCEANTENNFDTGVTVYNALDHGINETIDCLPSNFT